MYRKIILVTTVGILKFRDFPLRTDTVHGLFIDKLLVYLLNSYRYKRRGTFLLVTVLLTSEVLFVS